MGRLSVVFDSGLLKLDNILRGISPVATLWDGSIGFAFQAKTGGAVFTDYTVAANSAAANDVPVFDATMQVQDAFYFGENFSTSGPFNSLKLNIGTPGVYNAVVVWEYYNGAAWVPLAVVDGTGGFKAAAGTYYVTWTIPSDMSHVVVNGQDRYWVRVRVSAFTALTTAPLGTQIWLGRYPTSLANVTDGDFTISTAQASILSPAGSPFTGYLVFDLGAPTTGVVAARIGLWNSAGNVSVYALTSSDGVAYYRAMPYPLFSYSSVGEAIVTVPFFILPNVRYFEFVFLNTAAGSYFIKMYEAVVYRLGL